jgi:hypothetical protein
MKAILFSLILFANLAHADAKKVIIEELTERTRGIHKQALKEAERQFEANQSSILLAEENDKLTSEMLKELEFHFQLALRRQKTMFEGDGLKELQNLQEYFKRQTEKSLAIAQIENLEQKVSEFFKLGASQKVPEAKLTLINDYYFQTKQDEIQKNSFRASQSFIRKALSQGKKLTKTELDKMVEVVRIRTQLSSRMHFLYTHNLETDESLKQDLEFFKTNAYQRYLAYQLRHTKIQTEIMIKHMTKLEDKIQRAETKNSNISL